MAALTDGRHDHRMVTALLGSIDAVFEIEAPSA
jgi:hypothetical protein